MNRRQMLQTMAWGIAMSQLSGGFPLLADKTEKPESWNSEWDEALSKGIANRWAHSYDPMQQMLKTRRGPDYNYQTNIRSMEVHPTRESLSYACTLLGLQDDGSRQRAVDILKRVLELQVKDPSSRYYGLWSWYLEEPLEKMRSPDFNWADFNGAILLDILLHFPNALPSALKSEMRETIRAAAECIRRRNVSLYYTNIAFQGTFVTLTASELLADPGLNSYAVARLRHLAAIVDEEGSFAEYNSPTYMAVTIENLTRMSMSIQDPACREIILKLHDRAWRHIGEHWHAATMQLAGPMSRAYSNDIKAPLWIQKGTNNRLTFLSREDIRTSAPSEWSNVAILDYKCPEPLLPLFAGPTRRHQHREVFISAMKVEDNLVPTTHSAEIAPIEGTTFLTPSFSLGSANRSDFWIQRRPLLAYWGGPSRPPRFLQLRVLKDDYDFSSALFYSAQNAGSVLGAVRFRSDGGDKHPSLDRVQHGAFMVSSLKLEFLLTGWNPSWKLFVNGRSIVKDDMSIQLPGRIAIDTGTIKVGLQMLSASFGSESPEIRYRRQSDQMKIEIILMKQPVAKEIHWNQLPSAGCDFRLHINDDKDTLVAFDRRLAQTRHNISRDGESEILSWQSPDGKLGIQTSTAIKPLSEMDMTYRASFNDAPYPVERLSEDMILPTDLKTQSRQ